MTGLSLTSIAPELILLIAEMLPVDDLFRVVLTYRYLHLLLKPLLRKAAHSWVSPRTGNTALHWYCATDQPEFVAALLAANPALLFKPNLDCWLPLHTAAEHGSLAAAKVLIDHGGNDPLPARIRHTGLGWVYWRNGGEQKFYMTPLHLTRSPDMARLLIAAFEGVALPDDQNPRPEPGYSLVNAQNWCNVTALDLAVDRGDEDMARVLLEHDAEVKSEQLLTAVRQGNLGMVRALVDRVVPDLWPATTVHYAVEADDPEILKTVLQAGLEPDRPEDGITPLRVAVLEGRTEAVRLLLKFGANATAEHNGLDLVEVAREEGMERVAQVLLEPGEKLLRAGMAVWMC